MDPVRELPYGPAACGTPLQRPDTCQHPTTRSNRPKRFFLLQAGRPHMSEILCARPISSLTDEPFAEDDGELCLGLEPFARRSFPFLGRVIENQI